MDYTINPPDIEGFKMPEVIKEGSRNDTLTALAGRLRGQDGMHTGEIAMTLGIVNEHLCKPPLASSEIERIVESASKWERREAPMTDEQQQWHIDRLVFDQGFSPEEAMRLLNARKARQAKAAGTKGKQDSRAWKLVTASELKGRPRPDFLIDGLLAAKGLAVMYAEPEAFKTFQALNMAYAVATGLPYMGRDTKQAVAVYVAAEGSEYIPDRLEGLETVYGEPWEDRLYVLEEAPQVGKSGDVDKLIALIKGVAEPIGLIVIDTLSETAIGLKENQQEDMSTYFGAAKRLVSEFGAAVLILHHKNKGQKEIRGSTVIMGTVDTAIELNRDPDDRYKVVMSAAKQRGFERFRPIRLRGDTVQLGEGRRPTLVFTPDDSPQPDLMGTKVRLTRRQRETLDLLESLGPARHGDWLKAAEAAGVPKRSFEDARVSLMTRKLVRFDGESYRPVVSADGAE